LLSQRLPDLTLLQLSTCPTARACWEHLAAKYPIKESQWEQEKKQEEKELTKCEGGRTRCRGKHHSHKEGDHWASKCHTLKEGAVTVPAMQAMLGACHCQMVSLCISKNQHFLFHLIQSYYILFLLF